MRRAVATCIGLAIVIAVAVAIYLRRPLETIVDRRPELRKLVAEQEAESAQAVANYTPARKGDIGDIGALQAETLRGLPGVLDVDVMVNPEKAKNRCIVHLRDWHFVPRDSFAIDMADAYGRTLSADEIDLLYEQHLLEVELVQLEQIALLRCLIKHHGLKAVFAEGFASTEIKGYRERVAALRAVEKEQIPKLREQLKDIRRLATNDPKTKEKAKAIEAEIVEMLEQHRRRMLEMGSTGQLLISGELEDVLPLEDAKALAQSMPIAPDGKMEPDPAKIEARHDAQVREVMKRKESATVIVLGGSHDLSASIRRNTDGKCEYLRVTTKRYREVSE
jgi:hypothetical protein